MLEMTNYNHFVCAEVLNRNLAIKLEPDMVHNFLSHIWIQHISASKMGVIRRLLDVWIKSYSIY